MVESENKQIVLFVALASVLSVIHIVSAIISQNEESNKLASNIAITLHIENPTSVNIFSLCYEFSETNPKIAETCKNFSDYCGFRAPLQVLIQLLIIAGSLGFSRCVFPTTTTTSHQGVFASPAVSLSIMDDDGVSLVDGVAPTFF